MARGMDQMDDSVHRVSALGRVINESPRRDLGRPSKRPCRESSSPPSPQNATSIQVDVGSSSREAPSLREVQAHDVRCQGIPQPHGNTLPQGLAPQLPSGPPLQYQTPASHQSNTYDQAGFASQNAPPYSGPPPTLPTSQHRSAPLTQFAAVPYQSHVVPQFSIQHQGALPPQQLSVSIPASQPGPPPGDPVPHTGAPPLYHFATVHPGAMQPPEQLKSISHWINSLDLSMLQEVLATAASRHQSVFEELRRRYMHTSHEKSVAEHALNCKLAIQHDREGQSAQLRANYYVTHVAQTQAHQATADAENAVRVRFEAEQARQAEQAEQAHLSAPHARTQDFTRNVGEVDYILYGKWNGLKDSQVDAHVFEATELVEKQMHDIVNQVQPESSSDTKFNGLVAICKIASMLVRGVEFLVNKVASRIGYKEDFVAMCEDIFHIMTAAEKRKFCKDALRMEVLKSLAGALRGGNSFRGFGDIVTLLESAASNRYNDSTDEDD